MALITLLSEPQAKVGGEFYFMGPLTDCKDCRLKGVCFNLEPGSRYRVVEVRSQRHACEECEGEVVCPLKDADFVPDVVTIEDIIEALEEGVIEGKEHVPAIRNYLAQYEEIISSLSND